MAEMLMIILADASLECLVYRSSDRDAHIGKERKSGDTSDFVVSLRRYTHA